MTGLAAVDCVLADLLIVEAARVTEATLRLVEPQNLRLE